MEYFCTVMVSMTRPPQWPAADALDACGGGVHSSDGRTRTRILISDFQIFTSSFIKFSNFFCQIFFSYEMTHNE